MKIIDLKFWIIALLAVTSSFVLSSCDNDDDKKGEDLTYSLSLASEEDALLELPTDELVDTVVHITTDAPAELINVEAIENNGSWCTAKVLDNTTISIKAGIHTGNTDRTASFKITVPGAEPVEFTITQLGTDTQNTITLSGVPMENNMYSYTAPYKDGAPFSFVIKTNAGRWNIAVQDWNDPEDGTYTPWYSINKTSGRSGETVEIKFTQANEDSWMRNITLEITAGSADPVSITIMQNVKPATAITVYDAEWTEEIANNTLLSFNASDANTTKVEYGIDADGSIDVVICETGTSKVITDEESWLNAYYGMGTLSISPRSANTTGAERKLDVVLKGGETELFRIPVVQKAKI